MGNIFGGQNSTETSDPETDGDDKGHVSNHGSASDAEQARPSEVVSPPGNLTCKRLISTVPKAQNLAHNVAFLCGYPQESLEVYRVKNYYRPTARAF